MKRLLSVVAIFLLAASLLPAQGQAGLRGAFDPLTNGDGLVKGHYSSTLRGGLTTGSGTATSARVERWFGLVTTSSVVGSESVGEIYQQRNQSQAFFFVGDPLPLLADPTAAVSYIEPAWSKDGNWLAYVQTNNFITESSIYIQQFGLSTDPEVARTPLGSPILVADGTGGVHHRHPAWHPNGTQIAYDSDAMGSIDLWTVNVSLDAVAHTGSVDELSRTRHTFDSAKAEFKPDYSPDGLKLAYVTNAIGPFTINILNLADDTIIGAESNPVLVTHDNPSWSSDGQSLYYDAPTNEDSGNPQDIWKLDLQNGQKCAISVDASGDVDPDVSQYVNPSREGILFNYFTFTSQAAGFGVNIWRSNYIQNCVTPLPMAVAISPTTINLDNPGQGTSYVEAELSYPPSTQALGYVCRAINRRATGASAEGMRMRRSIIATPTMMGLAARRAPDHGSCVDMEVGFTNCIDAAINNFPDYNDIVEVDNERIQVRWNRRSIVARIVALGLVNSVVPLEVAAHSNVVGRAFKGFGVINVSSNSLAGSVVRLQQNYPNPFNPQTKINFAVNKPGTVDVRVFNTRGELVRTIVNQWYPQGMHTVSWDGTTSTGRKASSGVYFVRAKTSESSDVIKAVLTQ